MAGIYDGPYNHDCGWLECTIYDCPKVRLHASDERLAECNLNRDGSPANNPICGDVYQQPYSSATWTCQKAAGHSANHSQRGYPHNGWAA